MPLEKFDLPFISSPEMQRIMRPIHPPAPGRKRHRNTFTEHQKSVLLDFFMNVTHTPSREQKILLALNLHSDFRTITVWFQNQRQKYIKIEKKPKEQPLVDYLYQRNFIEENALQQYCDNIKSLDDYYERRSPIWDPFK